jgi:hypothetical protein
MLCGLMLNALVIAANVGKMPVVGMPSTFRPASTMWHAASAHTRLRFLADQARLDLFSVGDLSLLLGGILIFAICLKRAGKVEGGVKLQAAGNGFCETRPLT